MRKEFDLVHSLKRNDSSSLISRGAQDLPKPMMSFPTTWVRLPDNGDAKEQEQKNNGYRVLFRTTIYPYLFP